MAAESPHGPLEWRRREVRFTRDPFEGVDLTDIPDSLRPDIEAARELCERSLAPGTLTSYSYAWKRWASWCEGHGFDPFEHNPMQVQLWIVGLTTNATSGELNAGRMRPVSVGPSLAAIDRAAKALGQAPPSHHLAVKTVMAGIRRQFGMAPTNQRTPIEGELLCDLADNLAAPTLTNTRDAVVIALRGAGLSLGECSGRDVNGIQWEHVAFGLDSATIEVPSARGHRRRTVTLTDADLGWLRQLRSLSNSESSAVIDLSRQGVAGSVKRSLVSAGMRTNADLSDPTQRARIYRVLEAPTNAQLRDRALLTVGWFSALRRSNLDLLRWSDIRPAADGIELHIQRSKTDQEGHGATIYIPAAGGSGLPCPVAALLAYGDRLARESGVDITGSDEPVFVTIDRHDNFKRSANGAGSSLAGMSGAAIHEAVRRIVNAAGIDPTTYGSHSLRAGFITAAFSAGVSAADIAHTSLHADLNVLSTYNRPSDRRQRSAAAQMYRAASTKNPDPPRAHHTHPDGPPSAFMP